MNKRDENINDTQKRESATVVLERADSGVEQTRSHSSMLKREQFGELKTDAKGFIENRVESLVQGMNAINKGSKVTGNIVITQDLHINGDIEGDISGEEKSNIFIKGSCKGNIRTKGGSVEIEGDMSGGDIIAGGYVKVTGKFNGGKIKAKERININGEFSGSLESNEIEVGPNAKGKGEIFYKDSLCINKGARVEGRISRVEGERKAEPERDRPTEPKAAKKGFFS